MPASPRIARLNARLYRKRPRSIDSEINTLLVLLQGIKPSPRLPADVLSQYRSILKSFSKWSLHIKRLNARRAGRLKVTAWRIAQGARLADTADRDATLGWLLRREHRGRGLYAMAQGKRTAAKLGLGHYSDIGKLGAMRRWHPEQLEQLVMWTVGTVFPE